MPIRLDSHLRGRLSRAAKKMGSNVSSVIRFSILNQLPLIEAGNIRMRADLVEPTLADRKKN